MIPPSVLQVITAEIKNQHISSQAKLNLLKREIAKKHHLKSIPTNIEILLSLPAAEIPLFQHILLTKPVRTISGVTPVAVMTKPSKCPHGKCTFCPGGLGSPWGDVPQSYTGHEPATMRGIRNEYDSYLQVMNRLEQYILLGQTVDKIEIIVMGGTFPAEPKEYQEEFILGCFQAMNDFSALFFTDGEFDALKFKAFFELPAELPNAEREKRLKEKLKTIKQQRKTALEQEQLRNETAKVRCVALCIETKPDWGFLEHGNEMLKQGCTRVELGVQSVYDDVLHSVHRGHTAADSKKSIQILRDLGFKINFHYMPGLPLTDRQRDIAGMNQLFSDPDYRPDMIKLYPCMVGPGTALYKQWQLGTFIPISTQEAAERIVEFKKIVPEYCRIQRIQRDVPTKMWSSGVDRTNLRQYIHENYSFTCRCIRCREPKGQKVNWKNVKITVQEYEASGGKEFFIAAEEPETNILLG
ncbi:tRNA uridine(34) 5-carboxymethylaminomethyl modification radical SAM/GNAT enzyme Elp3, partial [Candidatus Woesearchaeota archaeon]|nr:tRNA uridine(34) 5-carboxymethylaminomethyl modification radical SAM/GNAT enzyme Elp3 [Candidatus Woesearchaeota archaeon]